MELEFSELCMVDIPIIELFQFQSVEIVATCMCKFPYFSSAMLNFLTAANYFFCNFFF